MRASLKKSTLISLAAIACAALLSAAPFDGAMARGDGSTGGAAAGPGPSGGGGPTVEKDLVVVPQGGSVLRPPYRRKIVVVETHRRGGCYVQAEQMEMELPDAEIMSFLNKCLASQ